LGLWKKGERVRSWGSNFRSLGFGISHPNFTLLKNSESLNSVIRVTLTAGEYYGEAIFLREVFRKLIEILIIIIGRLIPSMNCGTSH